MKIDNKKLGWILISLVHIALAIGAMFSEVILILLLTINVFELVIFVGLLFTDQIKFEFDTKDLGAFRDKASNWIKDRVNPIWDKISSWFND